VYALEDEPESGERWRRLGLGALITGGVLFAMGYGAQRYEPARRLIQQVVQMTVVPDPPKPETLPPPRTEPPPPPPRRAPPPQKKAATQTAPPPRPENVSPSSEPVVGLEDGSFGSGAGPSFQVGTTQMGDPTSIARAPAVAPPLDRPVPVELVPAGVPARVERCRYSSHAQRLGIEGLLVIETSIDADGRVTSAKLRKRLEDELDRECLQAVREARFQPATRAGRAVASTRLLRLRFELER
jgi:periplasmic protein TonB